MQIRQFAPLALSATAVSFLLIDVAQAQGGAGQTPVCVHNGPYVEECAGQTTFVPVTSTGSLDPDGTPISVQWFEECPWGFFDDPTALDSNYVIDIGGLCLRTCVFELRIFSGGQVTKCVSTASIEDTTAPIITGPPNITDIWGIPTDPGSTGNATAVDACDPAPVVTMIDQTIIPQTGPGLEQTIIRTWEAVDYCGHSSQVQQTITLLSPSGGSANLEVDINQCDDVFYRNTKGTVLELVLLGKQGTLVTGIQLQTLKLHRLGDLSKVLAPTSILQPQDVAVRAATQLGECNPAGTDGLKDLRLRFNLADARKVLGLDNPPAGSVVYIAVSGKRLNNTPFYAAAKLTLQ